MNLNNILNLWIEWTAELALPAIRIPKDLILLLKTTLNNTGIKKSNFLLSFAALAYRLSQVAEKEADFVSLIRMI